MYKTNKFNVPSLLCLLLFRERFLNKSEKQNHTFELMTLYFCFPIADFAIITKYILVFVII